MNSSLVTRHSSLPCLRPQGERKAGMALVIVLGLVSLLLISSVTFAIMMRIERASSANARNTTVARQIAKNALAFAIADIDRKIGSGKWADWQDSDRNSPVWTYRTDPRLPLDQASISLDDSRFPIFWKDTFGSVDHNITTNDVSSRAVARVLGNQMQHYLAPGIRHRAWAQRYKSSSGDISPEDDLFVVAPEWVPMTCGTNAVNLDSVVGRCAFLAFDTSGYFDLPALCASGKTDRAYGRLPTEIKPVDGFFDSAVNADKFKDDNKGRAALFENVAEICKANPSAFGKGAAFSAFNFCPTERLPTNGVLYPKFVNSSSSDFAQADFPFKNKICIAGDGGKNHIESLRRHKAAIIAAFMQSGLTASSELFRDYLDEDINDDPCESPNCTVCGGKLRNAFNLKKSDVTEQALWAYLGLIDYIDEDDEPFVDPDIFIDKDIQQFARPNVENNPLFNGFVATVKFTREESSFSHEWTTIDGDGNEVKHSEEVFDGTNANYKIELVGKVVFANRCSHDINSDLIDGDDNIMERNVEGKLAFWFDGGDVWDAFVNEAKTKGATSVNNGTLFMSKTAEFGDFSVDKANIFKLSAEVKVENEDGEIIGNPNDANEKNEKFWDFPEEVRIGAAGQVKKGSKVVSRFPAYVDSYEDSDEMAIEEYKWLVSAFRSEDEHASFILKTEDDGDPNNSFCYEEDTGKEVFRTVADAESNGSTYELKKKTVNLILWGELLDPRFSCASAAETPSDPTLWPKTVLPSHIVKDDAKNNAWSKCALAHIRNVPGFSDFSAANFGDEAEYFNDLMEADNHDEFDDFVDSFSKDPEEFGDYFEIVGKDDRYPGYSALQKYFLTSEEALNAFEGVTDGSRRYEENGSEQVAFDDFNSQYHSSFARNDGLDSVGELGFLPIGLYSTIRLFGFGHLDGNDSVGECRFHKNGVNDEIDRTSISMFNQVTRSRPYHRVLDYFSNSYKPVRGRINLNNCDRLAVASAFNGVALDDYRHDIIEDSKKTLSEDLALKPVVPAIEALMDKIHGNGNAASLSDLGRIYDADYYDEPDYYDEFATKVFNGSDAHNDNMAREAMIRNTCGLFTTRGVNMTLLLRGEAFTPFFGKSSVRNDLGTTLASRYALAQVWRDTEPDDSGKYPFFIQYFKIFDD